MFTRKLIPIVIPFVLGSACATESETPTATSTGEAQYADAETDPQGNAVEPARPDEMISFQLRVEGAADITGTPPRCSLSGAGEFVAVATARAGLDDNGGYASVFAGSDTVLTGAASCEAPDVAVDVYTKVVIRGEITATTQSCETYCGAKARQHAESSCDGSADQVTCRADARASFAASCETACQPTMHRLVAETELSAATVAAINAQEFSGMQMGEISADLVFDRIEDQDGDEVAEQ